MFYNFNKILSYNAFLNIIIGERGLGKTYGAIKFVINDFLKHQNEFVYIRRYKTELEKPIKEKHFFDALINNDEFPDHALRIDRSQLLIDDQILGYAMSLTTASTLKSTSYAKVKNIIFDEFLTDDPKHSYLKNEVHYLLDIIETIGRLRDMRIFLLGNAVTTINPYFNYFNLTLPYNSEFKTFKNGLIVVNYAKNEVYRKTKKASRFGQLIEGTDYADYAIDNQFLLDNSTFIEKKKGECHNFSTLLIDQYKFGVWRNYKNGLTYISKDFDPNNPCTFSLNLSAHRENIILSSLRNSQWMRPVVDSFKQGLLRFEDQTIKSVMMKVLNNAI